MIELNYHCGKNIHKSDTQIAETVRWCDNLHWGLSLGHRHHLGSDKKLLEITISQNGDVQLTGGVCCGGCSRHDSWYYRDCSQHYQV